MVESIGILLLVLGVLSMGSWILLPLKRKYTIFLKLSIAFMAMSVLTFGTSSVSMLVAKALQIMIIIWNVHTLSTLNLSE